MKTLTMNELREKSERLSKDELILDVRTPDEYAAGHVPGSRNLSHELVAAHADELRPYKAVYLYCRSGGRVQMAMIELASHGLTNLHGVVSGGMPDWVAAGYAFEK